MALTKQTIPRIMDAIAAMNPVATKPKKARKLKGTQMSGGMMRFNNFGTGSRTRCPRGSRRVKGTNMCRITNFLPIAQATPVGKPLTMARATPVDMYNPYLGPAQMAVPLPLAYQV